MYNRFLWIKPYLTCLNFKQHDWIFTNDSDTEINWYVNRVQTDLPIYFIICEKCNMHGIIRFGYLILTNDKLANLSCEEYMIKSIIE